MFGTARYGANAYATVSLETGVMAANPHKLIVMLFDGAKMAVSNALRHMQAREIEAKGKAISQAIAIINDGLHASLDKTAGGEIAVSLAALYDYMSQRLLMANLKNDAAMLEEVDGLLEQLRLAWVEIGTTGAAASTEPATEISTSTAMPARLSKVSAYGPLMPRASTFVSG
jgi:flagellar protein FliS